MENYSNISTEDLLRMASKKDIDAQAALAYRFADDLENEKNITTALEWGEKAFAKGRRDIAPLLAKLYFFCDKLRDAEKAFYYCSQSENDTDCLCMLANEFYSGKNGIENDDVKAYECIVKALSLCEDNSTTFGSVLYYMGNMYMEGRGVECNVEEAINWYLKSALKGNNEAYVALAGCYRRKNDFFKAKLYAEKACMCTDDAVANRAICEYNNAIRLAANKIEQTPCKLSDFANECDRNIHETLEKLNKETSEYKTFDKEANRLIKNAQTFDRIGNYKKVYPTYERAANEYPHDFRGWYNMARVFTNNFAVYSVFSVDDYGKLDKSEYYENITYAQRTVENCFENDLLKICDDYKNGCVDISVEELKNTLYEMYKADDCMEKAAEYARQYEDKITYLYNNKPCNVTALALHVLLNVLNNDNIKKYNEKVRQHNAKLDDKVESMVNDHKIEMAQQLKIENPKEYANNAEALQSIEDDEELQARIEDYRKTQKASLEYYSEITNMTVCDVYNEANFGEDRPYANYKPQNEYEYADDFVDFIVAFAEKCSIQMRGYEVFYSETKKKEYDSSVLSENTKDAIRIDYFNKFLLLKKEYSEMQPQKSRAFDELAEVAAEYIEARSAYEKANASNVFKQVFKGKELKEDRADVQGAYDAVCAKLDGIKNKIIANAKNAVTQLNEEFENRYHQLDWKNILYNEDILCDVVNKGIEKIKSKEV